jgi:hypothetical protein
MRKYVPLCEEELDEDGMTSGAFTVGGTGKNPLPEIPVHEFQTDEDSDDPNKMKLVKVGSSKLKGKKFTNKEIKS